MITNTPKTFISYSHDSQAHKKWVLDFATRLRNAGVDAILDQWELSPGSDLTSFMEENLVKADRVLMICTDNYVKKANAGTGGVGYEKMIVTSDLLKNIDSKKVIPIIRQEMTNKVPTFLKTKIFINFSIDDEFEISFDNLIREIHNAPLYHKPPINNNPFTPISEITPQKTVEPLKKLMEIIFRKFETNLSGEIYYSYLVKEWDASRVYLDILIDEALEKKYIQSFGGGTWFTLTKTGKLFIVKNNIDQM